MGDATKKQALEKLHAMANKIGYPDNWRDYSSVKIARDDYFGNVERATVFESRRQLAKIGKPLDRSEWQMTPPTVNAYYDAQMNDINFPAGVLQPPLFDPKMDDAPNYGNTGATIGHELTHGFDDEGRQFDAKGNLKDWWTKTGRAWNSRSAPLASPTSIRGYTVIDDIKINGKLTLGEDVADLGGTLLAYLAWKTATKAQRLQPIDGLTPDQRFFIGMAQWACGDERPESKRAQRHHQSAFAEGVPHQRRGLQHARVRQSLRLQSRAADGPRAAVQESGSDVGRPVLAASRRMGRLVLEAL